METTEIKTLLHHREPYLLVDKVLEINPHKIKTQKIHTGSEFYIQGHFPGAPVVPGAMQQEMCTQAAGLLLTKYHAYTFLPFLEHPLLWTFSEWSIIQIKS